jgi:hypothetical protein
MIEPGFGNPSQMKHAKRENSRASERFQHSDRLKVIVSAVIDMFKHLCRFSLIAFHEGQTMKPAWLKFLVAVPAFLFLAGCSGSDLPPRPKTVPVTGKVLYKGLPVDGATVGFLGDGRIPPALGKTDAQGRFELTTSAPGDGAVAGNHQVIVTKIVGTKAAKAATGPMSMEDAAKRAQSKTEDAGPQSLLPEHYGEAATSGLSFEVKASGPNDFTIDLKD